MLELHCADLGMACRTTVKAKTPDELLQQVAAHADKRHGVPALNKTLVNYALTKVRGTAEQAG
jgi:predicted small metal-binding protein